MIQPQVQDFSIVNGIRLKIRLTNKHANITSVSGGKNIAFTLSGGNWISI